MSRFRTGTIILVSIVIIVAVPILISILVAVSILIAILELIAIFIAILEIIAILIAILEVIVLLISILELIEILIAILELIEIIIAFFYNILKLQYSASYLLYLPEVGTILLTCSSPRQTFFLHALSFECTSKLCITFLNQFSVYFHI